MRKVITCALLILGSVLLAQNKAVLYNFTAIPQSLSLNPGADVTYRLYAGVPLLSGISANVGSTGFSAYDLFADNGVNFNTKLRTIIFSTSRNDKVSLNQQLEVFQGGFKVGDWNNTAYISFGMYEEFDVLSYVPKDLAILALDGNQNYLGKYFNLSDLNARAEMLSVFHVGYNKRENEKLIWGVRGKIYSSIFDARSTKNSGYLYTIPSNGNTMYEQVISADMLLNTSGIAKYDDKDDDSDVAKDIQKRALLGGNLGLGFDAGITYYPKKDIQITASVLDVGFIRHTKEVESYRARGTYKYEGILPDFFNGTGGNNITEEFNDAFPEEFWMCVQAIYEANPKINYKRLRELVENELQCADFPSAQAVSAKAKAGNWARADSLVLKNDPELQKMKQQVNRLVSNADLIIYDKKSKKIKEYKNE